MGAIGFGILFGLLGVCILGACECENLAIAIAVIVLAFGIGFVASTTFVNLENEQFCASFELQKETYENAIKDENLTGLERLELTGRIMELNGKLGEEKVSVIKWYNFNLSQETRDRTLKLTMIK